MESTVVSPSAPADVADPGVEARKLFLTLFGGSDANNVRGGRLNPELWTWCACCGSQFMKEDGTIGHSAHMKWMKPTMEEADKILKVSYGPLFKERLGDAYEATAKKLSRHNAPGVTFAFMPKDAALDILYSGDYRVIADGYEISDKDQGKPVSVLWLNA